MVRHLVFTIASILLILPLTLDPKGERLYILLTSFAIALLADGTAATAGRAWDFGRGKPNFVDGKSFAGSIAFGFTAWIVAGLTLTLTSSFWKIGFDPKWIWHIAALMSIVLAAVEALAKRGWDNLLIVLVCTGLLLRLHGNEEAILDLGLYTLLAIGFGAVAYVPRFLDASGSLLAGLMAIWILVGAGPACGVPPVAFFLLSSILSFVSARLRPENLPRQPRGRRRDAVQVLANGGVGMVIIGLYAVWPEPLLFWIYAASFAAAAADTWATEVGTAVAGRTISIIGGDDVKPGASGGISAAGMAASVLGAASVFTAAVIVQQPVMAIQTTVAVIGGGLIGSIVDSLLGATIQAIYRTGDGSETESRGERGDPNVLIRGWGWINNDSVNAICTLVGATFAILILYYSR